MVRKVIASKVILKAAGTVTKQLAGWLREKGYANAEDAAEAIDRGTEAAQALPRAEEFVTALHMLARESARGPILEEFEDDYARISRVGPREVWFESTGGEEVGPLVPGG